MLYTCPMRYEWRYVKGIKTPPGIALVTGTSTHAAVEKNLRNKLAKGVLLSEDEVADIARDTVHKVWDREGVLLDEDERAEGEAAVKGKTIDVAVALSRLHHQTLAPTIEPLALERTFLLTLNNFPLDLAGTIDIEEATRLRDTKTYGKTPSQGAVDRSLQLSLYGLAKRMVDGRDPDELCLDVILKNKTPQVKVFKTTRTDQDYTQLLRRVEVAARLIESGCFSPCAPDSWQCSKKFCGYYDICDFGARNRKSVYVSLGSPVGGGK